MAQQLRAFLVQPTAGDGSCLCPPSPAVSRIARRRRSVAAGEHAPPEDIQRFLRTINLTAVQLQAAFPHVGQLLHALAALSPRNPAAQRTVRLVYRQPR
jgi:hypothetical protein